MTARSALPPRASKPELAPKETAVVATLLTECPPQLPPHCAKLIENAPDSLDDLRLGTIAAAIRQLREASKPVAPLTVQEQLTGSGKLDDAGGALFLAALAQQATSADIAEYEATDLWATYRARRLKSVCADAAAAMEADPTKADAIIAGVRYSLDALDSEASTGTADALPPILDASEWIAEPAELPRDLVYGLLHRGSKLVLGGGSKTFKTWTLLDLAVSIASGEPWLSCKTTKGKVLYLNFEIQPAFFQCRINAIARAKGITLAPHTLEVWNLRGRATSYIELLPKIRRRIRDADYSLLVLDPIYKLYGDTDENSAGEVARLMNSLELVTVDTGASIAFGAHYAKGNAAAKEAIDRISGSGVFARDPDSILNFTRHEEADAFTVEATLRNHKPVEPFVVRWQYPLMRRCDELDPAKLKQAGGRPKVYTVDKLLSSLNGQQLNSQNWLRIASLETGISKSRFFALLEEAKRNPRLKQTPDGQWFYEDSTAQNS